MEGFDYVALVSRWIHILAAMIIVGGSVFMLVGALSHRDSDVPAGTTPWPKPWLRVVHACIAILLLTGGFNFYWLALRSQVDAIPYHPVFGIKLFSAMFVFFLIIAILGRSEGLAKLRAASTRWLIVIVALSAMIVLLSGLLGQIRSAT